MIRRVCLLTYSFSVLCHLRDSGVIVDSFLKSGYLDPSDFSGVNSMLLRLASALPLAENNEQFNRIVDAFKWEIDQHFHLEQLSLVGHFHLIANPRNALTRITQVMSLLSRMPESLNIVIESALGCKEDLFFSELRATSDMYNILCSTKSSLLDDLPENSVDVLVVRGEEGFDSEILRKWEMKVKPGSVLFLFGKISEQIVSLRNFREIYFGPDGVCWWYRES